MSNALDHGRNRLLASLSAEVFERLLPHLRRVPMVSGEILHEQGMPFVHVFFPTTAAVSLIAILKNGNSAQIGLIGCEGMVGTSMLLGGIEATRAVVACAGEGYCLHADVLKTEFEHSPGLLHLLLRYVQALLIQTSQTAICNRHHTVDQQLCRWLLLTLDRMTTNQVLMTQELIAQMLGVRREGVTAAAGKLQDAGLIQYSRGIITVLDRKGLEDLVCECYETVRHEIDRLVPMPIRPLNGASRPPF